jgi:sugar phosphate isomerase/epimerase
MKKYKTTPTCHDMFYDSKRFKGTVMPDEEAVAALKIDLEHASRLGCSCIRVIVTTPVSVVEACIPYAEEVGVRMLLEIHSPFHFDHEHIQKHFAVYERSGSKYVGFMPDMGIFVERFPRVISDRFERDGATPALVDLKALPGIIEKDGGNAKDVHLANMVGHFVYSDPRRLLDFMPWIHHVHGKFYDMTVDCVEPSIPYDKVIPVLAEGAYDGYISAEYEGQRHIQDVFEVDSVEIVRRYQEMLKREIAKVQ